MTPSLTIDAAAKAGLATGAVSPLGVAFTAGRRSREKGQCSSERWRREQALRQRIPL